MVSRGRVGRRSENAGKLRQIGVAAGHVRRSWGWIVGREEERKRRLTQGLNRNRERTGKSDHESPEEERRAERHPE